MLTLGPGAASERALLKRSVKTALEELPTPRSLTGIPCPERSCAEPHGFSGRESLFPRGVALTRSVVESRSRCGRSRPAQRPLNGRRIDDEPPLQMPDGLTDPAEGAATSSWPGHRSARQAFSSMKPAIRKSMASPLLERPPGRC